MSALTIRASSRDIHESCSKQAGTAYRIAHSQKWEDDFINYL